MDKQAFVKDVLRIVQSSAAHTLDADVDALEKLFKAAFAKPKRTERAGKDREEKRGRDRSE